jgi:hypothetical protein
MRRDQDASPLTGYWWKVALTGMLTWAGTLTPGLTANRNLPLSCTGGLAKAVILKLALTGGKSRLYDAALSWNLRVAVRPSKLACTTTEES